jgi:four helix bundle protein
MSARDVHRVRGGRCRNCLHLGASIGFPLKTSWQSRCWVADVPRRSFDLRERTKAFAFDIINLVKCLPRNIATDAIARQLIKAGTGVCANYRAAGRGRSRREFIAKLGVVVEEADEAELWLEALLKCQLAPGATVEPLYGEASELRAIFVQARETARRRSAQATTFAVTLMIFVLTFFSSILY